MHSKSTAWRGYLEVEVGVASTLLHTVKRIRSGTEEEEPLGDKMAAPPSFHCYCFNSS